MCAATGSTPIQRIRDNYPEAEPVEFDTYTECVDQLEADQIDAVSTDDIILAGYASDPKYEGLFRVVGETFSEEPYGIGLKKGDDDFRNFLNDTLEEAFEDGTWTEAFDATLGASGVRGARAAGGRSLLTDVTARRSDGTGRARPWTSSSTSAS